METDPPAPDEGQNLAAIAEQEAAQEAERKAAEGAPESKPAEEPPEETPDEQDPKLIVKYFDERYGTHEADKFRDDEAFLAGYDELIRMRGKRDDDAVLGKKVRGRLPEDQLTALLSEGKPQAAVESNDRLPWNWAWVKTNEDGETIAAPGAPKDALQRYHEMQQRMAQMADDPEKFFQKAMEGRFKELEEANATLKQDMQAEKEELQIAAWLKANADAMYVDGDEEKGWSSEGEKVLDWVRDPDNAAETPRVLTRLKYAARFATAKDRKPSHLKPPARAMRKPDVATKSSKGKSNEERFAAGVSLATILAEEAGMAE